MPSRHLTPSPLSTRFERGLRGGHTIKHKEGYYGGNQWKAERDQQFVTLVSGRFSYYVVALLVACALGRLVRCLAGKITATSWQSRIILETRDCAWGRKINK